jgi:exopolyphosphatase / guanosine-5'-triphosphate,3'-diphosphate pyrophosphatase
MRKLRKEVRAEIATSAGMLLREGQQTHAVATSKTFRQLARIAGAAPSSDGPHVKRVLKHSDVTATAERLAQPTVAARSAMPGVSESGPGSWPPPRSWPTRPWTCSASRSWRSTRGRCARA